MYKLYYLTSKMDEMKQRYIGYTSKTLEERLLGHIRDYKYKKNNTHKTNWIGKVINEGYEVEIFLISEAKTLDEILILERENIDPIFDKLTNSTNGGESSKTFSLDVREKISKKLIEYYKNNPHYNLGRRYKLTEEQKRKRNTCQSGENNPFYGKKHSEETKEKLRQANSKYKQFDYDELYHLYVVKRKYINEIAKDFNSTYKSVQVQVSKFDLVTKRKEVYGKIKGFKK